MTMRKYLQFLLAGSVVISVGAPAYAAGIEFSRTQSSQEVSTVTELYKGFLSKSPDVKVEAAAVDLDGSGTLSLVARFVSPATCDDNAGCHTVVLHYDGSRWVEVLAHKAKNVSVGQVTNYPNAGGLMHDIILNGTQDWVWNGSGKYGVTLDGAGTYIQLASGAVPPAVATAAAAAFDSVIKGTGNSITSDPTKFLVAAKIDVGLDQGSLWEVVATPASGLCDPSDGCLSAFVVREGRSGWRAAGGQYSDRADVILRSEIGGVHEIAMGDRKGYRTYAWDGTTFVLKATSYASDVTPAP
jgi:hypothetical protein